MVLDGKGMQKPRPVNTMGIHLFEGEMLVTKRKLYAPNWVVVVMLLDRILILHGPESII
jgi:hypothetical protein